MPRLQQQLLLQGLVQALARAVKTYASCLSAVKVTGFRQLGRRGLVKLNGSTVGVDLPGKPATSPRPRLVLDLSPFGLRIWLVRGWCRFSALRNGLDHFVEPDTHVLCQLAWARRAA
jgi:hypothetical protein